jgi:hypothetical protein
MNTERAISTFREGDAVVLAEGTYQGTPGIFLCLRGDVHWADIAESGGRVRSHPVAWLVLAGSVRAAESPLLSIGG